MKVRIFNSFLNTIADAGLDFLINRRSRVAKLLERPIGQMCHELLSNRGEASGLALAREIALTYQKLKIDEKNNFFSTLNNEFGPDLESVKTAARAFLNSADIHTLSVLQNTVESPRQELFRRLNLAPDGVQFLVRMREDLQKLLKRNSAISPVDSDLQHLFNSWFNRGFLEMRQIDWSTPANILEKLIGYEAVHEFKGWNDLRRRLAADRRCYAFFHPSWPDEPLIFVQVALVNGLANSISGLIDENSLIADPEKSDTAIFYSITNCQSGLRGVSFGNLLIKQVVSEINRDLANIKMFSTLSPVPEFARWVNSIATNHQKWPWLPAVSTRDWHQDEERSEKVRDAILRTCAQFLVNEKKSKNPIDPVARFHLGNGAKLERINWLANTSERGLKESFGIMVNYKYNMSEIIQNHEQYMTNGEVAYSETVEKLL